MHKQTIRHYLMITITGMFCWLTTGVVSAHVGATKTGWDDLAPEVRAEIAALKATVATLKAGQPQVQTIRWNMLANDIQQFLIAQTANVGALRTEAATNTTAISGLQAGIVPNLGTYLRIGTHNSKPAVIFEDANVIVTDGTGSTVTNPPTGLGNLIVGYDENSGSDIKTGSHNLVVGQPHTYSSYGGLVAGYNNNVTGASAAVSAGSYNTASGLYSSVSGGLNRTASGQYDWAAGSLSDGG